MLILASNSPRRRELLLSLGIPFAVEAADIEEIESLDDPREVPLRNAERKAAAVAARHPHDPVLGADTVIVFRDAVIGKPRDEADALRILLSLAGKTHEVVTGLALLRCADGFRRIWRDGGALSVACLRARQGRSLRDSGIRRVSGRIGRRFHRKRDRPAARTASGRADAPQRLIPP